MLKGKLRLLLSAIVLVALVGLVVVVAAPVKTQAALTGNAAPSVNVTAGGSLALTNTGNVQWGDAAAGQTKTGTLNCTVSCNVTTWDVKVSKNQDLTSGAYSIPSSAFTYTTDRASGSPSSGVTYQSSATEFVTTPGSNVASISSGSKANNLNVNCNYTLVIPDTQDAAASYTATHTYTLTVS